MRRMLHSHRYPSLSILCQTESEVVGSTPDPVACGWSTATSSRSGIWAPTFLRRQCGGLWCRYYLSPHLVSFYVLAVQSSNVHGKRRWALSSPWWQVSVSLRLCMGHSQQGFVVPPARAAVFWVCPLSFAAIVMTWPTLAPLPQWDLMVIPIPLRRLESCWKQYLFHKVNQHCLGVVTRASGSTITGANNFYWYMSFNIHNRIARSGANSTGYELKANWHISAKAYSLLVRWWDRLARFTISGMVSRILIKIGNLRVVCIRAWFHIAQPNAPLLVLFCSLFWPFTMDRSTIRLCSKKWFLRLGPIVLRNWRC